MQHSASSVALAERCPRAWWHRYRDKLKPPELTWIQAKRAKARGERLPAGAYSRALGTEMHRLAELYLTLPPRKAARVIDWNDLPGQCLAELVPHLPPAGSVPRRDVEARISVLVAGVRFRGLVDVLGASLRRVVELYDHKTSRDIRTYALLSDSVAQRLRQPKRSLKNDLQACMYVLARARLRSPAAPGGLCRWGYTETQRSRRALPVVQYIPTSHALAVAERAAVTAKRVEAFKTIEDAVPNTVACDQYGGCWYRSEGHCRVPRRLGAVFIQLTKEREEQANMGKLNFKALTKATAKANEAEEAKGKAADDKPAKRKVAPPEASEPEETEDVADDDSDEEEAPESEPAPKRVAKKAKASKRAPVEDTDDEEDAEPAPAKSPRAAAQAEFNSVTAAPDHILQYFGAGATGAKGEAKIIATAFAELAEHLSSNLPRNPERAQCLRKLLEANDCAVRAASSEA